MNVTLFGLEIDESGALAKIAEVTEAGRQMARVGGQSAQAFSAAVSSSMATTEAATTRATTSLGQMREAWSSAAQAAAQAAARESVASADAIAASERARASEQARILAMAERAEQERALIASAERLAASAASVDVQNRSAVQAYTQQAVAIRDAAAAMRALNLVEDQLQAGARSITERQAALVTSMRDTTAASQTEAEALKALEQQEIATAEARARLARENGVPRGAGLTAPIPSSGAPSIGIPSIAVPNVALASVREAEQLTKELAVGAGAASTGFAGLLTRVGALAERFPALNYVVQIATTSLASAAGATGGFQTALGYLAGTGGLIGIAVAGLGALAGAYFYLTRETRAAKEAADEFNRTDTALAARARAAQEVKDALAGNPSALKIDVGEPTAQLEKLRQVVKGYRAELRDASTTVLDLRLNVNPLQLRAFNVEIRDLQRALGENRITQDQFAEGLRRIEREFPDFGPQIAKANELAQATGAAAREHERLAAAERNAAAEGRALVQIFGQRGTSFDQGGEAAVQLAERRKALADAEARARAASQGGAIAVQGLDAEQSAVAEATKAWRDYVIQSGNAKLAAVSFTDALLQGHPAAAQALADARALILATQSTARMLAQQAEATRDTGEIEKQRALNGAYRESAVAQQILGLQLDATNQKRQYALDHTPAEVAAFGARLDALTKERIAHALLADQLERENQLRQARDANAGALESAQHARERASLRPADAEVQAVRDRAQEEIDAENRRFAALQGLTAAQRQTEATIHRERLANIREIQAADEARIKAENEKAIRESVKQTVRDTDYDTAKIIAMARAEREGAAAVEQLRIAQAGQDAVQRAINEAIARNVELTRDQVEDIRRSAEAHERALVMIDRYRELQQQVGNLLGGVFERIGEKGYNAFKIIWENARQGLNQYLHDLATAKLTEIIGNAIGIKLPEIPQNKQAQAGHDMKEAADKQLDAANKMKEAAGQWVDSATMGKEPTQLQRYAQQFLKVGAAAYGGYQTGYGVGQTAYDMFGGGIGGYAVGAIGGGYAGAKVGAAIGASLGPIGAATGAAIGGITGFVGGIIGVGDSAREAAEKLRIARKALDDSLTSAEAALRHDTLTQQNIAADQAQQQYLDQLKAVTNVVSILNGQWAESVKRIQALTEAQKEQNAAADALARRNTREDIEVQGIQAQADIAAAQGRDADAAALRRRADDLAFQHEQQRQREQFLNTHVMDNSAIGRENQQTYAELLQTQAYQAQAHALQENTKAINDLTTTVRNAPTGFKVEPYIQEFAAAQLRPGQVPAPAGPFVPPTNPLTPGTGFLTTLARDPMRELAQYMDRLSSVPTFAAPQTTPAPFNFAPPTSPRPTPTAAQPVTIRPEIAISVQIDVDGAGDPSAVADQVAEKLTRRIGPMLARTLDEVKAAANGPSMTRAEALERLPSRSPTLRG